MTPSDGQETLQVPAQFSSLAAVRRFILESASRLGACQKTAEDMMLAVDEAVTNIIVHGYQGRPGNIAINVVLEGEMLVARISDQAPLFDPTQVPPADPTQPFETRRFGGLGIFLARQCMDAVQYQTTADGWNELVLRKSAR